MIPQLTATTSQACNDCMVSCVALMMMSHASNSHVNVLMVICSHADIDATCDAGDGCDSDDDADGNHSP